MKKLSICHYFIPSLVCLLASLAFCSDLLANRFGWGHHDWDYFFFMHLSAYRSLVEFGEFPHWNPWSMGGSPYVGNPQSQVGSPWFLVHLALGPIVAFKVVIIAHYSICLGGMYWLGRELGMSRLAAIYIAVTFTFSTWLALRVYSGHYTYLASAYLPWIIGFLNRARHAWIAILPGGVLLALMVLQGTHDALLTGILAGTLALGWAIQGRTLRPLAALLLLGALGLGLSAVKIVPVLSLMMREHSRTIKLSAPVGVLRSPDAEDVKRAAAIEGVNDAHVVHGSWGEGTRWERVGILFKAFLGREQRGCTQYFVRSWLWHEYGAYLGPLGVLLVMCSFLVRRDNWPWIMATGFCFIMGLGNFSQFAPYRILHSLPLLKSMRCSSRFLIPTLCAGCVTAGLTLDVFREHLVRAGRLQGPRARWVHALVALVVAAALIDTVLVGRFAMHGVFEVPPPPIPPRSPTLVTIHGNWWQMSAPMLANQATRDGYEPLEVPVWVRSVDQPEYRGEEYFVPSDAKSAAGSGQICLEDWSPNMVRVHAKCSTPGFVVLNRNWDSGWMADPPYQVVAYQGLVATAVPPGSHSIRFFFRSGAFSIGLAVSLSTLVGWACIVSIRRATSSKPFPAMVFSISGPRKG